MVTSINPQEFQVNLDKSEIRTRLAPAKVTVENIAMLAKYNNLAAGDVIEVKCYRDDGPGNYSLLYGTADFVIVGRREERKRQPSGPVDIKEFDDVMFEVLQKGEWWLTPAYEAVLQAEAEQAAPPDTSIADSSGIGAFELPKPALGILNAEWNRVWNKQDRVHEVMAGDEVVFTTKDKDLADAAVANKLVPPIPG